MRLDEKDGRKRLVEAILLTSPCAKIPGIFILTRIQCAVHLRVCIELIEGIVNGKSR